MIIGLDTATCTGWCHWWGPRYEAGEIEFKKLTGIPRACAFSDWLAPRLEAYKPELVVFEGYGFGRIQNVIPLTEIGTMMRAVTHLMGVPYIEVPPMTLKKFTTGKGTSKKDEMMLAVYKRWGFDPKTNNEADAFALAQVGLAVLGRSELTMVQKDSIKKVGVSYILSGVCPT